MRSPHHDILSSGSAGPASRRTMIIGTVALLHIAIVYALISGMAGHIAKYVPHVIDMRFIETPSQPNTVPPPPKPSLAQPQPTADTIPTPVIDVQNDQTPTITLQQQANNNVAPQQPDTGAAGVSSTHSTPPYPAVARAQSHEGTVTLQLIVSAQGDVASASVIQSSGFPELDQAAVSWVIEHWKYKPAMQNGAAVPSQTKAAVKFDLKQASR